jgi:hypothetical protein
MVTRAMSRSRSLRWSGRPGLTGRSRLFRSRLRLIRLGLLAGGFGSRTRAWRSRWLTRRGRARARPRLPRRISGRWCRCRATLAGNVNTHIFRFDTGVWAHQTRGTLTRSGAATSGTWVVGNGRAGAPFDGSFVGEILAVGVWQQVLSDAQVASLVETDRCKLSTWLTVGSPVHIWGFTQASTGSAVTDLKGSATQSSLTGTTVFDAGSASLPWDADVGGGSVALAGTSAGSSSASGSLAGLPDAPSGVIGVPGPGSASVSFVAPYNGGSAILEYQAEAIQAVLLAGSSAGSSSARGVLSGGAASLVSSGLPTFTAGPVRSTTAPGVRVRRTFVTET